MKYSYWLVWLQNYPLGQYLRMSLATLHTEIILVCWTIFVLIRSSRTFGNVKDLFVDTIDCLRTTSVKQKNAIRRPQFCPHLACPSRHLELVKLAGWDREQVPEWDTVTSGSQSWHKSWPVLQQHGWRVTVCLGHHHRAMSRAERDTYLHLWGEGSMICSVQVHLWKR